MDSKGGIQAVCFDVGGVLIEIAYDWGETAEPAVIANDPIHASQFILDFQRGALTEEAYLNALSEHLNVGLSEAKKRHGRILKSSMPGVDRLVADLKGAGIKTGCLSNTNEPHWREMFDSGRFAAMEALDLRLASHRLGISKPDREAFAAFEELAGAEPNELVLFDDTLANCEAASTFGWNVLHVDPRNSPAEQMRNWLLDRGVLN